MKEGPRQKLEEMIRERDLEGLLEKATEFHGHYCHKVAYGIKAGLVALKELGIEAPNKEVLGAMVAMQHHIEALGNPIDETEEHPNEK